MEKIFHWSSTFKNLGETDDGGLDIKGSASTNALDRAGDIINADAWTKGGLDNFKNNPIILLSILHQLPMRFQLSFQKFHQPKKQLQLLRRFL